MIFFHSDNGNNFASWATTGSVSNSPGTLYAIAGAMTGDSRAGAVQTYTLESNTPNGYDGGTCFTFTGNAALGGAVTFAGVCLVVDDNSGAGLLYVPGSKCVLASAFQPVICRGVFRPRTTQGAPIKIGVRAFSSQVASMTVQLIGEGCLSVGNWT